MSRGQLRDDLMLAAYAVSLGFEVCPYQSGGKVTPAAFDDAGIPHDSLQFVLGDVSVWMTARGWRVARVVDGLFEKPNDSQFYAKLKDALDEGNRNWRDR